ncbi:11381_t:CDS:2 [Entrophospora sp. SA101]|nr:4462_t:CDS:2 [Entrophospora candida]CAH1762156.1 10470_t:CDS:2 [Entrophospora sp. SA101]CAJ0642233.1 4250_t:CDS:2 [Entrophospora sp. SA101]CAJ0745631.1 11381_t:CDS:2 [Entrophospora sp. SA101]CAJ0866287.1 3603_t:CDS:2 [Entrophospora sp. SA101]
MTSTSSTSVQFTVGKLDAGMAILLTEDHHLIEFPSLLLPPGVSSGSIVNVSVNRNYEQEAAQSREFWLLQEAILKEFGQNPPESNKTR